MNPNDHRLKTDTETIAPWYPALRPRRTHRVECWLSEEEYQSLCKRACGRIVFYRLSLGRFRACTFGEMAEP